MQSVKFNKEFIEKNRNKITKIKLSAFCQTSYPCWHSVTFKMDKWYESDHSVHATHLLEFYHLMDKGDKEHMLEYFTNKHFVKYFDIVVDKLVNEIKELKTHIKYMPGGEGYKEAKESFESFNL